MVTIEHQDLIYMIQAEKEILFLEKMFDDLHTNNRLRCPPIFIFTKVGLGRNYQFRGLAVPGAQGLSQAEDLVAIWKAVGNERFQNYKAIFTVLNVPLIKRNWIKDIISGNPLTTNCPQAWLDWVKHSKYLPLKAEPTQNFRKKEQQLPSTATDRQIIQTIITHFRSNPFLFEHCAAELVKLMDANVISCDVTRPRRDGGRDAIGEYRIGGDKGSISVTYAMEAKLYRLEHSVGVKECSRLISRIRNRQFGIFVTTSFVALQAYKEITEDKHPIIIISANDIIRILKNSGYRTKDDVAAWLASNFPVISN